MTKIFTMTHKKFREQQNPIYVPLHVGRAAGTDIGYLGDDTGDSISALNCYYGELTGLYWIWKNYRGNENIGICHYRRYFVNEEKKIMTEEEYDRILSNYDIITSNSMKVEGNSYWEYYARAHNIHDLEQEAYIIQRLYPNDYPVFCEVMNGKEQYVGNLMVTGRKGFDAYCAWLFPIFFELKNVIDVSGYDAYHKRVFGFLAEQLLKVWVKARKLNVYECSVALTAEKAETVELKLAVGQLIKQNQIEEAQQLFYEVLKIRPDLPLEASDLKQELFIIEQILYICELEKQQGISGILSYSNDLQEMIKWYYHLTETLVRYQEWTKDDIDALKAEGVTELAVEVVGRNCEELTEIWKEALEIYRS